MLTSANGVRSIAKAWVLVQPRGDCTTQSATMKPMCHSSKVRPLTRLILKQPTATNAMTAAATSMPPGRKTAVSFKSSCMAKGTRRPHVTPATIIALRAYCTARRSNNATACSCTSASSHEAIPFAFSSSGAGAGDRQISMMRCWADFDHRTAASV